MNAQPKNKLTLVITTFLLLMACNMPKFIIGRDNNPAPTPEITGNESSSNTQFAPPVQRAPGEIIPSPTPDFPHNPPNFATAEQPYYVQSGDTIRIIANNFNIDPQTLIDYNNLIDPDFLSINQLLLIPPKNPTQSLDVFKLIPDSELVNGPYNHFFNLTDFVNQWDSELIRYREEINGKVYSGLEIVKMVATDYSVNPRLLLALLEYQSGWVTQSNPNEKLYPMGYPDPEREGLFFQLTWTANTLNQGFYAWQDDELGFYITTDGELIAAPPTLNAGTVAVHYYFAHTLREDAFRRAVGEDGFIQTYQTFYGVPFDWAVEPLFEVNLRQPELALPFEPGVGWYFTGGAHGGWNDGSAWAALDFAPPADILGCVVNKNWVTAVADGVIVRAENGAVVQDLDGDGNPGTGWTIFYMHIETADRVIVGSQLKTGDRIGHPSCEGGYSTGTHLHIARKYNGAWVAAGGSTPFSMSGWTAAGADYEYGGYLYAGGETIPACECQDPANTVGR